MHGRLADGSAKEADNRQQVMMWQRDAGMRGKKQSTLMTAELPSFMEGRALQHQTKLGEDGFIHVAQFGQKTPRANILCMIY